MDYNKIVEQIVQLVGGQSNISNHTSCMTRLRISVKDLSKVDQEKLAEVEGALGLNVNDDELQIIFGPGKVTKAREAMDKYMESHAAEEEVPGVTSNIQEEFEQTIQEQKSKVKAKRTTGFQKFMSKFSNIFVPLIPGFIAAGTMAGIAALITSFDGTPDMVTDIANYLAVFNKSLLTFLFIMVGYNASTAFGGSGVIGGILAGLYLLTYGGDAPTSGMQDLFGVTIDPRGGMIGVLFTAIIGAYVEQFIRKHLSWESTDIITTPILTLLVMSLFTFLVIMPISYQLFEAMNWLFLNLTADPTEPITGIQNVIVPVGSGVLAALFLPSVMLGIHQGFVPVYQGLVESIGVNTLFPILAMAGASQVGTAIALFVKAKPNTKTRAVISGAIIPGFLGIGEPLIYGVTLPRVRPFITSMIGAFFGGAFVGLLGVFGFVFGLNTVFGASGLLGTFAMVSVDGAGETNVLLGIGLYLISLVVSYIAGFIVTYFFGTKNVDLT